MAELLSVALIIDPKHLEYAQEKIEQKCYGIRLFNASSITSDPNNAIESIDHSIKACFIGNFGSTMPSNEDIAWDIFSAYRHLPQILIAEKQRDQIGPYTIQKLNWEQLALPGILWAIRNHKSIT